MWQDKHHNRASLNKSKLTAADTNIFFEKETEAAKGSVPIEAYNSFRSERAPWGTADVRSLL